MNSTERRDLRKLIAGRFDVLAEQFRQREKQLREQIRVRIIAEHAAQVEQARTIMRAASDQLAALNVAIHDPQYGRKIERLDACRITVRNMGEAIDAELRALKNEHGSAQLNLSTMRQQLDEELLLGSVTSDEARAFLERIPTLDALLPAPETAKQLT